MVSWLTQHRGLVLAALAVSAVVVPLVLGIVIGQIPRGLLFRSVVPLAAASFLLAFGIHAVSNYLDPLAKLVVLLVFGLVWMGAGVQMLRIEKQSGGGHPQAAHARRGIACTCLVFGAIWVTVTLIQFLRPKTGF